MTYTMTNGDGSLFGSGSFYVTEDRTTSLTMNSLTTSCIDELNSLYAVSEIFYHPTKKQLHGW